MAIQRSFQGLALGRQPYATAAIQGTGINPVHSLRGGEGRNTAPDGTAIPVDAELTSPDDYGYMTEDVNVGWSAADLPSQTGMADHPDLGASSGRGMTTPGYPAALSYPVTGFAGGEAIRSVNKGADRTVIANVRPRTNGDEGWQNKETGQVIEPGSGISDPIQYVMQTSMEQLHRTRAGSQSSGTASKYNAPITTRVPGQKVQRYVSPGSSRHQDMTPVSQHVALRPFRNRTAGTGRRNELLPNAMYMSEPLTRVAPPDPYQGVSVPMTAGGTGSTYGYTVEDGVY